MKRALVFIICVFIAGCVEIDIKDSQPKGIGTGAEIEKGMSRRDVIAVMGDSVIIGYEQKDNAEGTFIPIVVDNPYRRQTLRSEKKIFYVLYFFTEIKNADNQITDEELTPYVFEYDNYIGKGWDFLKEVIIENEISQ